MNRDWNCPESDGGHKPSVGGGDVVEMFLLWDVGKGVWRGVDEATLSFLGTRPTAFQGCSSSTSWARRGHTIALQGQDEATMLARIGRDGRRAEMSCEEEMLWVAAEEALTNCGSTGDGRNTSQLRTADSLREGMPWSGAGSGRDRERQGGKSER